MATPTTSTFGTPTMVTDSSKMKPGLRPKPPGPVYYEPPPFRPALPSADLAAAFAAQRAALTSSYTSTLAALKGQRMNLRAKFEADKAAIEAQTVGKSVAAEGQAVDRGVLGGSADVKNRIAVKAEGAALTEQARMEKQQAIYDTYLAATQAGNTYQSGLIDVQTQEAMATAAAQQNAFTDSRVDIGGRISKAEIIRDGDFGSIVKQLGQTQIGAQYVFGDKKPGESFDCSGLTSYIMWKATGHTLPHHADTQMAMLIANGAGLSKSQLQPGDLVFFNWGGKPAGHAEHVAIYIGNGMILDSSGGGVTMRKMPSTGFLWGGRIGMGQTSGWSLLPQWSADA